MLPARAQRNPTAPTHCGERDGDTDISPDSKWRDRETGDAFESEIPQFPSVEFGRARAARIASIHDGRGFKSYPREQAFHEATTFGQVVQRVDHHTIHETKVADVGWDFDVGDGVVNAVKRPRGKALGDGIS